MAGRRGINAFARRAAERAAGRIALRAAAWAIAYVLVLQVVLAGFALGSMPIGMDPALCVGAAASDRTTPDGDPAQHSHCQACLARADLPALPPPPPAPNAAPLAGALRLDFSAPSVALHAYVLSAFRARAPPASA